MNITRRDRHHIVPAAYITLAIFIVTNSRHSTARFNTNSMTTPRRYSIFRPPSHSMKCHPCITSLKTRPNYILVIFACYTHLLAPFLKKDKAILDIGTR
jgi:hypothetical protein